VSSDSLAINVRAKSKTAVRATKIEAVYVTYALPWLVVGEGPGFQDVKECGFAADRAE
jgi:hypothetical protein